MKPTLWQTKNRGNLTAVRYRIQQMTERFIELM